MAKKAAAVAVVGAVAARPLLAASGYGGTSSAFSNSGSTHRDRSLGYALLNKLSLVQHNEFMDLDTCTPAHLSDQKKRLKQNVVVHVMPYGGHAHLTVGRDYMNFYPQDIGKVPGPWAAKSGSSKKIDSVMRHPSPSQSLPRGTVSIELPFINGEPILEFIRKNAGKDREKYNLFSNNCATMVAKALMSSTNCRPTVDPTLGDNIPVLGHLLGPKGWTPEKVLHFAKELTELAGEPLRSSVARGRAGAGDDMNKKVSAGVAAGTTSGIWS